MTRRILICLFMVLVASRAGAGTKDCTRSTCQWNPFREHQRFSRGNYVYFVETEGQAAGTFILRSGQKVLLSTDLKELSSNVWVTWSQDNQRFAITWSDGGTIGSFHVRVFAIASGRVTELSAVNRAVQDFRSRHYCKTRGNNVEAYKWETPDRLVLL